VALRAVGMVLTTSAKLGVALDVDQRLKALEHPDSDGLVDSQETTDSGDEDVH
jgi:hypothetical protein